MAYSGMNFIFTLEDESNMVSKHWEPLTQQHGFTSQMTLLSAILLKSHIETLCLIYSYNKTKNFHANLNCSITYRNAHTMTYYTHERTINNTKTRITTLLDTLLSASHVVK